jgi:hypothetical protein
MQTKFCTSVFHGDPIPPILLWERKDMTLVLDGQQRLTALGATVVRVDGTPNTPTKAFFDARTGTFAPDPRRWHLTAIRLARWNALNIPQPKRSGSREWAWAKEASHTLRKRTLVTYILGPEATVDDAIVAFRAINTPGIPIDPDELASLLSSREDHQGRGSPAIPSPV